MAEKGEKNVLFLQRVQDIYKKQLCSKTLAFICGDGYFTKHTGVIMKSQEVLNLEDILAETNVPVMYFGDTMTGPTESTPDNVYYGSRNLEQRAKVR